MTRPFACCSEYGHRWRRQHQQPHDHKQIIICGEQMVAMMATTESLVVRLVAALTIGLVSWQTAE